jgi:hypothetical protein
MKRVDKNYELLCIFRFICSFVYDLHFNVILPSVYPSFKCGSASVNETCIPKRHCSKCQSFRNLLKRFSKEPVTRLGKKPRQNNSTVCALFLISVSTKSTKKFAQLCLGAGDKSRREQAACTLCTCNALREPISRADNKLTS